MESENEIRREPRKKRKQATLERYMNMNGREKRKRNQATQGDLHSGDTDDTGRNREQKEPKQTDSRLIETIKRKGIG